MGNVVNAPVSVTIASTTVSLTLNQPSGLTLITHYNFPDSIPASQGDSAISSGWNVIYNGRGLVVKSSDNTDPFSPPNVVRFNYPIGYTGGEGPATLWCSVPNIMKQYTAFSVKISNPWQGHPTSVNKLDYMSQSGGSVPIVLYDPNHIGLYELRTYPHQMVGLPGPDQWLTSNIKNTPFTFGVWHIVEWFVDISTGTIWWALDGIMQGRYTNWPLGSTPFSEHHLDPVWGGAGGVKTENDWIEFGEIFISGA